MPCSTQPWYDFLEAQRYPLAEEEARDRFLGVSWPHKLLRLAERQTVALDEDEQRWAGDRVEGSGPGSGSGLGSGPGSGLKCGQR